MFNQLQPLHTHFSLEKESALRALGGYTTIKAAVNIALSEHVKQLKRQQLLALRGQMHWQGDLDTLRATRDPNVS